MPGSEVPTGTTYGAVESGIGGQSAVYALAFNPLTGTPLAGLHHPERWKAQAQALIDGEQDVHVMAEMAKTRMRSKIPDLVQALNGTVLRVVDETQGGGSRREGWVLRDDAVWRDRATAFAARVRDTTEILAPRAGRVSRPLRVVYQDACHLAHGQRVRAQPRALLRAIDGVTLVEIAAPERCCGSAGIYNLTQPALSRELQREKVEHILAARPDIVVSANPGCMLQVAAGLRDAGSDVPVVHVARFLADPEAFA